MKIAGLIIQNKNIFENNETVFFAKYKGHEIHASLFKKEKSANNHYSYQIIKLRNRDNIIVCSGILQRCTIRDVLMHVLNEVFN